MTTLNSIVHRLLLTFFRIAWEISYLAVAIAWVLAWYPVWLFTGKNIVKDPEPPYRWMDKAP